jgi:hypothetical protein
LNEEGNPQQDERYIVQMAKPWQEVWDNIYGQNEV